MRSLVIGNFEQGLIDAVPPERLPSNALSKAEDVIYELGRLKERGGSKQVFNIAGLVAPNNTILATHQYVTPGGVEYMLAWTGNKVFYSSGDLTSWTDMVDDGAPAFTATAEMFFANALGVVVGTNGSEAVWRWDPGATPKFLLLNKEHDQGLVTDGDGTTLSFDSSELTQADDYWNNFQVVFLSKTYTDYGAKKPINDFVAADDRISWVGALAAPELNDLFHIGPNIPISRFVAFWHNRVFVARTAADPSRLYYSDLKDLMYFPLTTTASIEGRANLHDVSKNDGQRINGILPMGNFLFVCKESSTFIVYARSTDDPINWITKRIDPNLGCLYQRSMQVFNIKGKQVAIWFSHEGWVISDGNTVQNITKNRIPKTFNRIQQAFVESKEVKWTDKTQNDPSGWDQGTQLPAGSLDLTNPSGDVKLTVNTELWTLQADWDAAGTSHDDTEESSGDLRLKQDVVYYDKTPWGNLLLVDLRDGSHRVASQGAILLAASKSMFPTKCSWDFGSIGSGISEANAEISFGRKFGDQVHKRWRNTGLITGTNTFDSATAGDDYLMQNGLNYYLRLWHPDVPGSSPNLEVRGNTGPGGRIWQDGYYDNPSMDFVVKLFGNPQEGIWISEEKDCGDASNVNPIYGDISWAEEGVTTEDGDEIHVYTFQTASTGSYVEGTDGYWVEQINGTQITVDDLNGNTDTRRFTKVKIQIFRGKRANNPRIESIQFDHAKTKTATLELLEEDTGESELQWSTFEVEETLPGDSSIKYEVKTTDVTGGGSYVEIFPGDIIPQATFKDKYIQILITFETENPSNNPTLHEIRAYYGKASTGAIKARVGSIVTSIAGDPSKYLCSVAQIGKTNNNWTMVVDQLGSFWLFNWSINDFVMFKNQVFGGSSLGGVIYQLFSGASDDGNQIKSIARTGSLDLRFPFHEKYIHGFQLTAPHKGDWNLGIGWAIDPPRVPSFTRELVNLKGGGVLDTLITLSEANNVDTRGRRTMLEFTSDFSDLFNDVDNFQRANNGTLGGVWVESESPTSVTCSVADTLLKIWSMMSTTSFKGYAYWNDTYGDDQYASVTFHSAAQRGYGGPSIRIDPNGSHSNATLYQAIYDEDTDNVYLYKYVNETLISDGTLLGTYAVTIVDYDVLTLQGIGSDIRVKINGVTVIQVTDTAIATGKAGVSSRTWSGAPTGDSYIRFRKFEVGEASLNNSWELTQLDILHRVFGIKEDPKTGVVANEQEIQVS